MRAPQPRAADAAPRSMKKEIVINASKDRARIAIVEDGELVELYVEHPENVRTLGNIYLGKVAKVMSQIHAAFVDIGQKQDAFLHFSDLTDNAAQLFAIAGEDIPGLESGPILAKAPKKRVADDESEPDVEDTLEVEESAEESKTSRSSRSRRSRRRRGGRGRRRGGRGDNSNRTEEEEEQEERRLPHVIDLTQKTGSIRPARSAREEARDAPADDPTPPASDEAPEEPTPDAPEQEEAPKEEKPKRSRSRSRKKKAEPEAPADSTDETAEADAPAEEAQEEKPTRSRSRSRKKKAEDETPPDDSTEDTPEAETSEEKPKRSRSRSRTRQPEDAPPPEEAIQETTAEREVEKEEKDKPRRLPSTIDLTSKPASRSRRAKPTIDDEEEKPSRSRRRSRDEEPETDDAQRNAEADDKEDTTDTRSSRSRRGRGRRSSDQKTEDQQDDTRTDSDDEKTSGRARRGRSRSTDDDSSQENENSGRSRRGRSRSKSDDSGDTDRNRSRRGRRAAEDSSKSGDTDGRSRGRDTGASSDRGGRNRGRSERNGRDSSGGRDSSRGGRQSSSNGSGTSSSVQVPTKPEDLLSRNGRVLVKITKEPISSKGSRVSTDISLAGRFLVLVPAADYVAVSKKIESAKERRRLRTLATSLKPNNFGVIVRTVAAGRDAKVLDKDLKLLVNKWRKIEQKLEGKPKPPVLLYEDVDMVSSIVRDLFTEDYDRILVDDPRLHKNLQSYIKAVAPQMADRVVLHKSNTPVFRSAGLEKQVAEAFSERVNMKGGGYLIIEHTEAMHVVDVNSGRAGRGKRRAEENLLNVNLEAAREIAKQLRLRDLGGIIVVDFIDLRYERDRRKVTDAIKKEFAKDRAVTKVIGMSDFGVMQITRQRLRPSITTQSDDADAPQDAMEAAGAAEILQPENRRHRDDSRPDRDSQAASEGDGRTRRPTRRQPVEDLSPAELAERIRAWLAHYRDVVDDRYAKRPIVVSVHPLLGSYLRRGFPSPLTRWRFRLRTLPFRLADDPKVDPLEFSVNDQKSGRSLLSKYPLGD
ncbi:MAG: Rne/Rng family ribonuclease [Bacteroidota bacterium]